MHGLVRCKHERRCSRTRGEDASFTDVKIKPQIGNWDQRVWITSCTGSVGWWFGGFEKKQWIEFQSPNERVENQTWARPDEFVRYRFLALVGLRADDVKAVSIERLCVSLFKSRKTFKLKKLNKSFIPETISWMSCISGFAMSIAHIRILWVCYRITSSEKCFLWSTDMN